MFWGATLAEFLTACDGLADMHGPRNSAMTSAELRELMARYPDKVE